MDSTCCGPLVQVPLCLPFGLQVCKCVTLWGSGYSQSWDCQASYRVTTVVSLSTRGENPEDRVIGATTAVHDVSGDYDSKTTFCTCRTRCHSREKMPVQSSKKHLHCSLSSPTHVCQCTDHTNTCDCFDCRER